MLIVIAHNTVLLVGALIIVACTIGLLTPRVLIDTVMRVWESPAGLAVAVAVRLLLGVLLAYTSTISKYPITFLVLGVIAIIVAISIPIVGRSRISKLIYWFASLRSDALRGWLIAGMLFGAFLIYGLW